ncbi:sensor histidine kinase [Microbacterium telephonicum]|uniref:Signal transduction histidine kinase n=1 Tax=Microbacterium telephonicum TaxID=1714841 RepID=A0A498CIW1_9MICO|nr:sensor histidine kinase [Microbacterium telephonicum]RLK52158.1 signal transduction histidine kinase [Microbacterium telephonicum]
MTSIEPRPAQVRDGARRGRRGGAAWAIRLGQTAITTVLLVIAVVRAAGDGTPLVWAVSLALVFAGWYVGGLILGARTRDAALAAWWLGGLALIWAGTVAVSAEFVWLAFPLWLLAGFILRLPWAIAFSFTILAVVVAAPVLHSGTTTYANVIGPVVGGVFAFGIARGYLELVRDERERRRLIASLVAAQAETAQLQDELARTQRESGAGVERTRISRDIHDTVAQSLSSIGMLARAARTDSAPAMADALDQIDRLSRDGLVDARRIVNAMAPTELEGSALGDALRRMLAQLEEDTGIRTDLRIDEGLPALSMGAEVALLRTAQSALANVRAHARASRVVVTMADAGDAVRLDIADDGVGFDATRWGRAARRPDGSGYGLRAMRARLRELGGDLDIESTPGDGLALSASLPFGDSHGGAQ